MLAPDDPRDDHRPVARGRRGTRRSRTPPRGCRTIQAEHGVGAIGGITSSRCTNEEVYVVQKMVRAAFGNNNVDTCARVCHSPTGYGLKQTFGTSAGTQDFQSVDQADVILVIGANPTDAHPVFASRMKRGCAQGAAADRRRPAPHRPGAHAARRGRPPPAAAPGHQRRRRQRDRPRRRDRGPGRPRVRRRALRAGRLRPRGRRSSAGPENSPEAIEPITGVPADGAARRRPALRAGAATPRSTTASASPSTARARRWSWAWPTSRWRTGNIGRDGVGVNPLRGQNNVQGSCDMGSFPHELPGYRHVSDDAVRGDVRGAVGHGRSTPSPACASRTCSTPRSTARSGRCSSRARTSRSPTRTPSTSRPRWRAMDCVVVQDLFLNETAKFAHVFLPGHVVPGEGRHVHQRRAADQPGAPGDAAADGQAGVGGRLRAGHRDGLPDALRRRRPDHGRDRGD